MPSQEKTVHVLLLKIGLVFTLTGTVALVYEQIFQKILGAVVGTGSVSASTVLATFFAGIALGSAGYARILKRIGSPLWIFAASEGTVGFWGLFILLGFEPLNAGSYALMRAFGEGDIGFFLGSLAVSVIWVFPFTFAMGLTFPAVVGLIRLLPIDNHQKEISRFYALNLLGATLGTLIGAYFFFPVFGLIPTLVIAAIVELGAALFFLYSVNNTFRLLKIEHRIDIVDNVDSKATQSLSPNIRNDATILLCGIGFISGFVVFGFEVVWNHLIATVLGNSVYAFANMLFSVLLGLLIAGIINSWVMPRSRVLPNSLVIYSLSLAAIILCTTLVFWDNIPSMLLSFSDRLHSSPFSAFAMGELVRLWFCLIFITIPTISLGMVYPFLFRSQWFPRSYADRVVSLMGASNAVGSVSGALVAIYVLIPLMGTESTFQVLTLVCASGALLASVFEAYRIAQPGIRKKFLPLAVSIIVLMGCGVTTVHLKWDMLEMTSGVNVYFQRRFPPQGPKLQFLEESVIDGFVTVVEYDSINTLLTNGKFQGNDAGEIPAQVCIALIPILHLHKTNNAAVLGVGTGQTAAVVHAAGFNSVDILELSPSIVSAAGAHFSHVNKGVLNKKNTHVYIEDGRTYLLVTDTLYDLISIEVSSIWFAGSTNIYSRDFYKIAKSRLADRGILQQWVQLHHISPNEVFSILRTVRAEFPHVALWGAGGQGIILASKSPLTTNKHLIDFLASKQAMKSFLDALKAWDLTIDKLLHRQVLLDSAGIDRLVQDAARMGIPINTDKNRFLEFQSPRYNLEPVNHREIVLKALFASGNR